MDLVLESYQQPFTVRGSYDAPGAAITRFRERIVPTELSADGVAVHLENRRFVTADGGELDSGAYVRVYRKGESGHQYEPEDDLKRQLEVLGYVTDSD